MSNHPATIAYTFKVRFGGHLPVGSIVIPEINDDKEATGNGWLVSPEALKDINPSAWLVAGPNGYIVRYRGDIE